MVDTKVKKGSSPGLLCVAKIGGLKVEVMIFGVSWGAPTDPLEEVTIFGVSQGLLGELRKCFFSDF